MRIVQSMAGAKYGGAEAFFMRLVMALNNHGVDQSVVLRHHTEREKLLTDCNIKTLPLTFGGILDLFTRLHLGKEIQQYKPDIVLSWMNRAASFCPKSDGRFIHCGRLGGYYNLKYYRTCDHLIGNTKSIVNYVVKQGWSAKKAHYLPNFVTPAMATPIPRSDLKTPEDATILLALGRLHENKAYDVLVQAMTQLPESYLWLAGEGPLKEKLYRQAQKLSVAERIRFIGWQENSSALYASADLVVCPSRVEPLGNVVLEAWAHRKPIIASATDGPKSLIQNKENGILVSIDDAEALAAGINYVLYNPDAALTIVENAYENYLSSYSEAVVVKRYLEFFEYVIGRK